MQGDVAQMKVSGEHKPISVVISRLLKHNYTNNIYAVDQVKITGLTHQIQTFTIKISFVLQKRILLKKYAKMRNKQLEWKKVYYD